MIALDACLFRGWVHGGGYGVVGNLKKGVLKGGGLSVITSRPQAMLLTNCPVKSRSDG